MLSLDYTIVEGFDQAYADVLVLCSSNTGGDTVAGFKLNKADIRSRNFGAFVDLLESAADEDTCDGLQVVRLPEDLDILTLVIRETCGKLSATGGSELESWRKACAAWDAAEKYKLVVLRNVAESVLGHMIHEVPVNHTLRLLLQIRNSSMVDSPLAIMAMQATTKGKYEDMQQALLLQMDPKDLLTLLHPHLMRLKDSDRRAGEMLPILMDLLEKNTLDPYPAVNSPSPQ